MDPVRSPGNFAGPLGAFAAVVTFQLIGYSAYLLPVVLCVVGWHYFWCTEMDAPYTKAVGAALLVTCTAGLLALAFSGLDAGAKAFTAGGMIGLLAARGLAAFLNGTGAAIVLLTLVALGVILSTQFSFGRAAGVVAGRIREQRGLLIRWREWQVGRRRERERQQVIQKHMKQAGEEHAPDIASKAAITAEQLKAARTRLLPDLEGEDDELEAPPKAKKKARRRPSIRRAAPPTPTPPSLPLDDEPVLTPAERRQGGYVLPPVTLLDAPRDHQKIDERELMEAARLLEEKTREFSVDGSGGPDSPGPGRHDLRVQAPRRRQIQPHHRPGGRPLPCDAGRVGADRPHPRQVDGRPADSQRAQGVHLAARAARVRDVHTRRVQAHPGAGQDDSRRTVRQRYGHDAAPADRRLDRCRQVGQRERDDQQRAVSLCTPDDVRFIMIDPKRLELGMYEDIPHLLTPVVVDPKQAANALRWAVREMEERYKLLAAHGVRNIDQFNRNVRASLAEDAEATGPDDQPLKTLPYIMVIIDELADLMMVAGKEVEESIARLAQMARAVGIHLILATQRPSVDVITGVIKANLPSRIAFRVASKIDSRTILDGNGAEQLLGKGDMLYLPPASSRFVRIHGPYISEQETARLCSFLRKQGKPDYDTSITEEEKTAASKLEFDKDALYDEAARIVVSSGQASISYLQRRLRIGFSRAARLIDSMEMDGVVSPAAGGKREVLVDQDYFEEVDAQLR